MEEDDEGDVDSNEDDGNGSDVVDDEDTDDSNDEDCYDDGIIVGMLRVVLDVIFIISII